VSADGLEDHALTQRPFAHGHPVEPEELKGADGQARPGGDEVGATRLEPLEPSATVAVEGEDLLLDGFELGPRDGKLVDRKGCGAVARGRHHAGQVAERAARSHHQLGLEVGHRLGDRCEHRSDVVPQPAAIALGWRVVAHQLRRQAAHAELDAGGPKEARAIAHHDLEAAAPEVEAHSRVGGERHARPDGGEGETSFVPPVDDLHRQTGGLLDALDDVAAVLCLPQGAGGTHHDLLASCAEGQRAEAAGGLDRLVGDVVRDAPLARDPTAKAQHLLLLEQRLEASIGMGIDAEEVEGVGAEVERGDAHHAQPYGDSGPSTGTVRGTRNGSRRQAGSRRLRPSRSRSALSRMRPRATSSKTEALEAWLASSRLAASRWLSKRSLAARAAARSAGEISLRSSSR
jgi:hypothetical protein